MLFICGEPSRQYVLVHGSTRIVDTLQGKVRENIKPVVAKFTPVTGLPFVTNKLRTKDGKARGKLYTEDLASQMRQYNQIQLNADGEDITERWVT